MGSIYPLCGTGMFASDSGNEVELLRFPLLLVDGAKDDHSHYEKEDEGQDTLAKAARNGEDQAIR